MTGTLVQIRCRPYAVWLTPTACAGRWTAANGKGRRTAAGGVARPSNTACRGCPVGEAHAAGRCADVEIRTVEVALAPPAPPRERRRRQTPRDLEHAEKRLAAVDAARAKAPKAPRTPRAPGPPRLLTCECGAPKSPRAARCFPCSRRTANVTVDGVTRTLHGWAVHLGISREALALRARTRGGYEAAVRLGDKATARMAGEARRIASLRGVEAA